MSSTPGQTIPTINLRKRANGGRKRPAYPRKPKEPALLPVPSPDLEASQTSTLPPKQEKARGKASRRVVEDSEVGPISRSIPKKRTELHDHQGQVPPTNKRLRIDVAEVDQEVQGPVMSAASQGECYPC